MPWVETIYARMAASTLPSEAEQVFHRIRENVAATTEGRVRIVIYRRQLVESDWAIHLYHESDGRMPDQTWLGIKLAEEIRQIALVDHSVWIEQI